MTQPSVAFTPGPRWLRAARLVLGLVLGLGVIAALAAGQGALTARRWPDATTVVGEMAAGRRIGQTFVATYSGLSAIDLYTATYARPNTGTLVLHIRADAHAATDLATVRWPVAAIPNNAWLTLPFPPLANRPGTPLYFELEDPTGAPGNAPTIYWYTGPGDPYGSGQVVLDGAPQPGDLTFGLRYTPPIWGPWILTAQTVAARLPTRPAWTLLPAALLLGLLLLRIAYCVVHIGNWEPGIGNQQPDPPRTTHHAPRTTHCLIRNTQYAIRNTQYRLPLLLAVAFLHAWLWLWIVPPWQGPDEPQHLAATLLWARQPVGTILVGPTPAPESAPDLESAILAAMDRHGFTRTVEWYGEKGGAAAHFIERPAFGGSSLYVELRQPSLYYRLAGLVLRLVAGDGLARLDPDLALYLARGVTLTLHLMVVGLGWTVAALLTPGRPGAVLRWSLPLGLALLPMPVFIETVVNNDALAAVAGGVACIVALAWFRLGVAPVRPATGKSGRTRQLGALWALTALAVGICILSKSTAVPVLLLLAGALVMAGWWRVQPWWARQARGLRWGVVGAGVIALMGLGGALLAGVDTQRTAAAWSYNVAVHADRRTAPDAHDGAWVLAPTPGQPVIQRVDLPPGHPPLLLAATAWARAAAPGPVQLALQVDGQTVNSTSIALPGGATWTLLTVTATAPVGSLYTRVLVVSPGAVEADDLSLSATAPPGSGPVVPPPGNLLLNPSAEMPAVALAPPLRQLLAALPGLNADQLADALINPLPLDGGAVLAEFAGQEARSFLGLFGWVSLPLPDAWYALWGLLALGAGVGLVAAWPILSRLERAWLGLAAGTVIVAVALSLAKQLAELALFGLRDFPQGRYLFVLLILPILWLFLTGWRGLLRITYYVLRITYPQSVDLRTTHYAIRNVALAAWVVLLAVFAAWALLALVVPYYYGG